MNGGKKKQHYVPRFYLKYFTDNENKFYAYDFDMKRLISDRVYYESQCYKKYFYGEDGILEEQLSKKEGKWSTACRKAVAGDALSEADIMLLKEFVLYQKQRTNDNNNRCIEERESIIKEWARHLYNQKDWEFDDAAENFCKQRAEEEISPAENVIIASKMLKYIEDLGVLIVRFSTKHKLLTNDSPVVTVNAFMKFQGYGYDNVGVAFLMPLSPSTLLIVYDDQLYNKYKGSIYVESTNEDEVLNINRYEIIHSERMFFLTDIADLDLVTDEILDYRQREERRNKTQYLGPEGSQRLIMLQAEGMEYYYELPYIILPREYRRIPYNCREAIPRHFEKGWDNKLAMKYQVLSMTKKLSLNAETKRVIPSKADLKIGCRRMESLAKSYWKAKGYNI